MWRLSTAVLLNSSYAVDPSGLHRISPGTAGCNVVLLCCCCCMAPCSRASARAHSFADSHLNCALTAQTWTCCKCCTSRLRLSQCQEHLHVQPAYVRGHTLPSLVCALSLSFWTIAPAIASHALAHTSHTICPLQGRTVDFKNTLIIMTSNVGSSVIEKGGGGLGFQLDTNEEDSSYNRIKTLVNEELKQYFRPEFLNR